MDRTSLATLSMITGLVAGAVWLSALLDRKPKVTEVVSAAIKAEMVWFIEFYENPAERKAVDLEPVLLCIASKEPLDFALLADQLSGTFLQPLPVAKCTSRTVEGDFGMFSAMTYWFDETGEEAGMLVIEAVRCPTSRRCIVDINTVGSGMRHEIEKTGDDWAVTKSDRRWVV